MRHAPSMRYIRIIEYSTGIVLYSFPQCSFIPIESYNFPAIISFNSRIWMMFQSLMESHYDSSICDGKIGASVASTEIGVSFLVCLLIMVLATITYISVSLGLCF